MRFCLDEDLSNRVARLARGLGIDVISSHEVGRDGLSDEEQLRLAAEEGRCFVTRNANHFVLMTVRFFERQWPHAGVLLVPRSFANDGFSGIAGALEAYARRRVAGLPSYAIDLLTP